MKLVFTMLVVNMENMIQNKKGHENLNPLNLEERLERASYSSLDLYGICAKFVLDKKII